MTLEELRYHHWEPISVTLDRETVTKYVPEAKGCEIMQKDSGYAFEFF